VEANRARSPLAPAPQTIDADSVSLAELTQAPFTAGMRFDMYSRISLDGVIG
jgi:hypothetical protein